MADDASNLHGSAPDSSAAVLLIVDMLADFQAIGGATLEKRAKHVAQNIQTLRKRTSSRGIPTIFVNDNVGRWRSDAACIVRHTSETWHFSQEDRLRPDPQDYFVVKPKHSAFFATPLELLLTRIGARTLILTGSTDVQCILFSAMDAYVRDYQLTIPIDCVLSMRKRDAATAQYLFREVLKARVTQSQSISLRKRKNISER